jgi:hypothetical protein
MKDIAGHSALCPYIRFDLLLRGFFMSNKSILIDLSHTIEDGLITYKGLPAPVICDYWSREESRAHYAEGTEFHIGKIEMVANTGTYLDSPFHRFADGADLSQLNLEQMVNLEGVLVRLQRTTSGRLMRNVSPGWMCAARRCWCIPDGHGTGKPTSISRGTRF